MFLAVFSATRGNWPAMTAVLDALDDEGIETIFHAGDAVGAYPWPNETIDALRKRRIPAVQGFDDRAVARFLRTGDRMLKKLPDAKRSALAWTHKETSSANIEWLGTLCRERRFTLEGIEILLCYGAPTGMKERLAPDTPDAVFERQREAAGAHLIVCGGSDEPFVRRVEETMFVCPGALTAGPVARYAVIDTEETPWTATFGEAPYDAQTVEARRREAGLPEIAPRP